MEKNNAHKYAKRQEMLIKIVAICIYVLQLSELHIVCNGNMNVILKKIKNATYGKVV